jgi:hypothetical protein
MSSFADFKQKMNARNPQAIADAYAGKSYIDSRFWKLATPAGKEESTAVIRFLPQTDPEKTPFKQYYHFGFQEPTTNEYYVENCLNSLGEGVPDPCSEENKELWNKKPAPGQDPEIFKNIARKRKRKIGYIANILVIQDKSNPENNGKVFLFKFGAKVLEKITIAAAGNTDLGKAPFDPTDFDTGANFALTMQKEDSGFFGYDKSTFGNQSPIPADIQERVYESLYDLDTILVFKSYDELKSRLDMVLGRTTKATKPDDSQHDQYQTAYTESPAQQMPSPIVRAKPTTPVVVASPTAAQALVDADDEAFFASLL